jgi:hypothetical protein
MHVYKCLPIIGTQSAYIIAVKRDERGNKMAILSKLDAEVIRYHREVEDARDDIKRNQPTEAKTMANIQIYRDDIWVGSGTIDIDGEIECSAALGPDQDASDETYCKIMDAIDNEPQDEARYTGRGSIERPDGTYSWIISD